MNLFEQELSKRVETFTDDGQATTRRKSFKEFPPSEAKSDLGGKKLTREQVRQLGVYEPEGSVDPNWYDKLPPDKLRMHAMSTPEGGNPFEAALQSQGSVDSAADPFAAEMSRRGTTSGTAMPGAPPQTLLGGFTAGFKRGLKNDTALVKGAIGVGLNGLGMESGNEWLDDAIATQQEAEKSTPRAVGSFSDIGGIGDAAMYASETLGEQVPTILGLIATGGLGGAALKWGGRKLVEKGVATRLAEVMAKRGVIASTLAGATTLETGASGIEQKAATGEVNVPLAIGAGLGKGALETITPMALSKTLGITDDLTRGLISTIAGGLQGAGRTRILKAVATGAATEGATETLQEAVDIAVRGYVDKNYDALGPEAAERLLNAGIGGALVGGTVSGGVSALSGEIAPDAPVTLPQLREAASPQSRIDVPLKQDTLESADPEMITYEVKPAAAGTGVKAVAPVTETGDEEVSGVGSSTTTVPSPQNLNEATPGSDPRDEQLGFELLPTSFKDVPARDETDLIRAPLEVAVKRLTSERDQMKLQEAVDEKKQPKKKRPATKGPASDFVLEELGESEVATMSLASGRLDAAINSLLNAGAYARKDRVPTILEGMTEGNSLVTTVPDLMAVTQFLPPGFQVQPIGSNMLNVKTPEGRTLIQVPNKDWVQPIIQEVSFADRELWTSGFYNTAAKNITKMREMGAQEFLDTRVINPRPLTQTVNLVKKLRYHKIPAAANMNVKPSPQPKITPTLNMLESDTIKFTKYMSWWNTLLQIGQKNPNYTPLTNYIGAVQSEQAKQMHILSQANDTIKLGQRLGKDQLEAASNFLWDLEQQTYRGAEEVNDRWPTIAEEMDLIRKHSIRRETYRFITQIREQTISHFNGYAAELQQEALKITGSEGMSQVAAMQNRSRQLANIEKMKQQFFSRPRFPFTNIGDYVVEVRDTAGELIEARLLESKSEQAQVAREFQVKYGDTYKVKTSKIPLNEKQWINAPDMVLRSLRQNGYLSAVSAEQMQVLIYLSRSVPGMKRRFIHGASTRYGRGVDLLRAFANDSSATAANLFKMRVTPKLNMSMAQMDKDRKTFPNTNTLGDMITFVQAHMKDLLNPQAEASRLRSLAFMWHISFVPASALLNATQVPIVTLPYLGTRFGNVRAMAALQKNYLSFNTFYSAGKLEMKDDIKSKLQSRGIRDGFLDQSFATELSSLSEGTNLSRMLPGNRFDRTLATFSYYGGFMFQAVEKMNRNVTFNAAVDLALQAKNSKYLSELQFQNKQTFDELLAEGFDEVQARAFLAGRDAVNRTQFEYSRWNRPKFMKGPVKGTIFTFWLFTQGMLNFGRSAPGAWKYWMIMLATAGMMGLPGAEDLKDVIRAASQWWFGTDFDVELEARRYIATLINPWLKENDVPDLMRSLGFSADTNLQVSADLLLHGLSQDSFGLANWAEALGVPYVPHVDMSGSLSMGRLAPIDMTVFRPGLDWNMRVSKTVERLAGAALGPSVGMLNGLFDPKLPGDDFKVWEKAMPRIMRSFLRAGRISNEGGERTRTGSPVLEFDPMDPMHNAELWMMAAGFQPTRLTKAWDKEIAKREVVSYWDARKSIILNQYWHAKEVMNDKIGTADMQKAIDRYNKSVPWKEKRITRETLKKSMQARKARKKQAEKGLPVSKSDRPAWAEIEQIYE